MEGTSLDTIIRVAQIWAWVLCVFGGIGNILTVLTIAHQFYLGSRSETTRRHRRRQQRRQWRTTALGETLSTHDDCPSVLKLKADTILLLHLSVCDLLYCTVNLPFIAINYSYAFFDGAVPCTGPSQRYCTGTAMFRYVNAFIEWMTLGLLAVQRCIRIGKPEGDVRIFTPLSTCLLILGCWVGTFLLQTNAVIQVRNLIFIFCT